jgi:pimeloyl-ACP methyl ester carboxylesterase
MKPSKRFIFNSIKIVVILYCGIGIALYYLQEKLLLHPVKLPANKVYRFNQSFQEINIPVNKTDTINLIRFIPVDDTVAKGAVIYFHGNAENVESYANDMDIFLKNHFEVWMPDYPGFGKSSGEISEKKLNEQAYQVKRLVNTYFADSNVIIYGRSFGTGIAANLASSIKAKHLILEAPYYSIPDLFSSYVPIYPMQSMANFKFPVGEYLKDVQCPITIFHGTIDEVIPTKCSMKLKASLKKNDQFLLIRNGKHNDLSSSEVYKKAMIEILK